MEKHQVLVIKVGNSGDRSVGIWDLDAEIRITVNGCIKELLEHRSYKDNLKQFLEDIKDLALWLYDMKSEVPEIYIEENGKRIEEGAYDIYAGYRNEHTKEE